MGHHRHFDKIERPAVGTNQRRLLPPEPAVIVIHGRQNQFLWQRRDVESFIPPAHGKLASQPTMSRLGNDYPVIVTASDHRNL
jgi:hypothetical protein